MKKFIDTINNIFSIEELRGRIIMTFGFLLVFRLGSFIVLPGVNPEALDKDRGGIFGLLDNFLGGAFSNASIFALGIMPYISASIVFQLLTVAFPYFQKLQNEGESGRKKLNQMTRVLTILICVAQSIGYIKGTIPTEAILVDQTFFLISSVFILCSGTIFCMWIGEKITDKGIGNGISMLIMIGIISRFPSAIITEALAKQLGGALVFLIEIVALFFVIMGSVMLTQATRRVPVQYAKQVVGNRAVAGGQRQFIPLKVNASGVMPIIFAQAIMFVPGLIGQASFLEGTETGQWLQAEFGNNLFGFWYNVVFALLIIIFTYFYTAITVPTNKMADDLKRSGGFIPGIRPGTETAEYLDKIMSQITLPGSIFLALVAIFPAFVYQFAGVQQGWALFFGGTSLLIMVGVAIDTMQQINSYLLNKHYDGLMKTGKNRKSVTS